MSSYCDRIIFIVFIIYCPSLLTDAEFKFTNIQCKAFDPPFAEFPTCRLSLLRRNVVGLSIYVKLYQLPVNNVSINLSLWKKANGYRPFLYNFTTNFCGFMANRMRYPFLKIFFDLLLQDSNINHTCPYNHDIIVKNLVLKESMFKRLPLPSGEYLFKLMVAAYNHWKAEVKAYVSTVEKL